MPAAIIPFPPRQRPQMAMDSVTTTAPLPSDAELAPLIDELVGLEQQLLQQRDLIRQAAESGGMTPKLDAAFFEVIDALVQSINLVVFAFSRDR